MSKESNILTISYVLIDDWFVLVSVAGERLLAIPMTGEDTPCLVSPPPSLPLSLSLSLLSSTKVYPERFVGCNVIELDWVSTDLSFLPKTHREHKIHSIFAEKAMQRCESSLNTVNKYHAEPHSLSIIPGGASESPKVNGRWSPEPRLPGHHGSALGHGDDMPPPLPVKQKKRV